MSTQPFTFNEDLHEYRVGSQAVPSCTSVLAEGGLVAHRFITEELLDRKSAFGREVHKACHLHNHNNLGEYDPRVKRYLDAWIMFKMNCKSFKLICSEFRCMASLNGMYYGMTLDCNAYIDGEDTVIELKTGAIYPHHAIQTAGYATGLPHPKYTSPMARFIARKRMAVELRSNGVPKIHRYEDKSDFEVFASLLHVATWKRRYEKIYQEKP